VSDALNRSPLHERHAALGARFVPFAGWEMAVQYSGVTREHEAVRSAAGLFDVSHMGELFVEGPGALAALDRLVSNAVAGLAVGRALYTVCCNEAGTILDDLIVYRLAAERLLVVCNASNRAKIAAHFQRELEGRCSYADRSDEFALLALQGPRAAAILQAAGAPASVVELPSFGVVETTVAGLGLIAARTGYTGEDGFELFCASKDAGALWDRLMASGGPEGLLPIGLGARDTLRLEAKLALYGNDIDETTNPFEAGLGWVVKLDKGPFIGRDALARVKQAGIARKLVGFELTERGIARHGYPIVAPSGAPIGTVTSGGPGLTVGKNIGLGYVPNEFAALGTALGIEIRGKVVGAVVVNTPFYRRAR
jgi:aminomethyltransferase